MLARDRAGIAETATRLDRRFDPRHATVAELGGEHAEVILDLVEVAASELRLRDELAFVGCDHVLATRVTGPVAFVDLVIAAVSHVASRYACLIAFASAAVTMSHCLRSSWSA